MSIIFLAIATFLILLVLIPMEGKSAPNILYQNGSTSVPSRTSAWVKNNVRGGGSGCGRRPWVCREGEFPRRSLCCWNRCVNVSSDKNNCGLCGIRCPFNWQCCRGLCRNINFSSSNCGKCGQRCPYRVRCSFGVCGYA
ncbi:hypothetical protein PHAVU_006G046600 [Phaseolus vulgaris]|uniref:Stigma-specific Stig1 family protein n=1 Tax=Phaseolus vulgaris TaxID=3885 RepID=V7BPJ4_PHAVU|nr:hypothetical protein PHAVU_006G046600g [Phaseolus vulgaris]ESW18501.1 hypothetical protein PHAVU_006G046600g [Phaseolus vulgaris]